MTTLTRVLPAEQPLDVSDIRAWFEPARIAQHLTMADIHVAMTLVRLSDDAQQPRTVTVVSALTAALTNRAGREGHSAIRVDQLVQQGTALLSLLAESSLNAHVPQSAALWTATLLQSPAVGNGGTPTPLVLHDHLVQFKRYYDAEQRIAAEIQRRLTQTTPAGLAAFAIVTGGPGTGKTTHIARTIVELHASHPTVQVALAAPTGKAAARLTASVRERMAVVAAESQVAPQSIREARTLHRLLQFNGHTNRFRRTPVSPLTEDLIIVDEVSMVDILMLDALLRAVRPDAALLLVGDHQQLASVDSGDALGALWRASSSAPDDSPWRSRVTVLTHSFRFAGQSAIGRLANAILKNDADTVVQMAGDAACHDVQWIPLTANADELLAPVIAYLTRCLHAKSPEEFLDALEAFRILSPEREGPAGVDGVNRTIEQWLATHGSPTRGAWYHRRPVMVTANDYGANIFNGDIGVVWRDGDTTAVYFRTGGGELRTLAPTRLPAAETAWAMTVHKAQGSEFDTVMVVVPERESRVMNRQLLYTAVTRAKRHVTIVTSQDSLQSAISRVSLRISGLERAVLGSHALPLRGRNG